MGLRPRVSSIIAPRQWKIVKIALVMTRKELMSKRKFISDMIDGARERMLIKGSRSLSFNHYNHSRKLHWVGLNGNEYEFSCSNSPNPVIIHSAKNKRRYFPCMRLPKVIEDVVEDEPVYPETLVFMAQTPECTFNIQIERRSPLLSPCSVRVSNFSSDDEGDGKYGQVDHKAEEFISRFYDQLRKQMVC